MYPLGKEKTGDPTLWEVGKIIGSKDTFGKGIMWGCKDGKIEFLLLGEVKLLYFWLVTLLALGRVFLLISGEFWIGKQTDS